MQNPALRSSLFRGITTNQIVVAKGIAELSKVATPDYVRDMNDVLDEPLIITPGVSFEALASSRQLNSSIGPSVAAMLGEIARANKLIDQKHDALGGLLGNAIAELELGAAGGYFRRFEGGAIYVSPHGDVFEVHGAIYAKYLSLRAEAGLLGYPLTDETSTLFGTGKFNHFQGGSIYWTGATGAWEVHGAIRNKWWALDGDRSVLGYPVSDEEDWNDSSERISHFERGRLVFNKASGSVRIDYDSVILTSFLSSDSVTCNVELSMNSAGHWRYRGHMHNSGFVQLNVNVGSAPRFQNAKGQMFARWFNESLGGTTDFAKRDGDWDDVGRDDFVRDNWDFIRSAGMVSRMTVGLEFTAFIGALTVGAVVLVGTVLFGGRACPPRYSVKRDPLIGQDVVSATIEVVGKDEKCE